MLRQYAASNITSFTLPDGSMDTYAYDALRMLEQIIRELEADRSETREIPVSQVRNWMASTEPDVRGATYGFLHSVHVSRVKPPLSLVVHQFEI